MNNGTIAMSLSYAQNTIRPIRRYPPKPINSKFRRPAVYRSGKAREQHFRDADRDD